jgi:hypothetical protein
MTVAHQDLSQLTPRMIGALSNIQTKVVFGIGRKDAEFIAKLVGRVDPEVIKRVPKTDTQYELFITILDPLIPTAYMFQFLISVCQVLKERLKWSIRKL